MSNFLGYLLRFGDTAFPNKYITHKSYKISPDQRLEINAFRDANSLLHRITSDNYKTKIEFNTIGNINEEQLNDIFNIMKKGLIDEKQRKYRLIYWNMDTGTYTQSDFYMPNIDITINSLKEDGFNSDITYEPIRIAFIEY